MPNIYDFLGKIDKKANVVVKIIDNTQDNKNHNVVAKFK